MTQDLHRIASSEMEIVALTLFTAISSGYSLSSNFHLHFYHDHHVPCFYFVTFPLITGLPYSSFARYDYRIRVLDPLAHIWVAEESQLVFSTKVMPSFKDIDLQTPFKGQNMSNADVQGKHRVTSFVGVGVCMYQKINLMFARSQSTKLQEASARNA